MSLKALHVTSILKLMACMQLTPDLHTTASLEGSCAAEPGCGGRDTGVLLSCIPFHALLINSDSMAADSILPLVLKGIVITKANIVFGTRSPIR